MASVIGDSKYIAMCGNVSMDFFTVSNLNRAIDIVYLSLPIKVHYVVHYKHNLYFR